MDTNYLVSALSISGLKVFATLLVLAGAIYGFVSEKVAPDVVALLAILALLLTGDAAPRRSVFQVQSSGDSFCGGSAGVVFGH